MLEIGEVIVLEDEKEFIVIDMINYDNKKYLMLSNVNNASDLAVRILDNNMIKGLSTEEELIKVLELYSEKQGLK